MNLEDRLSLLLDLLLNTSESGIRKLSEQEIQGEVNIFLQVVKNLIFEFQVKQVTQSKSKTLITRSANSNCNRITVKYNGT